MAALVQPDRARRGPRTWRGFRHPAASRHQWPRDLTGGASRNGRRGGFADPAAPRPARSPDAAWFGPHGGRAKLLTESDRTGARSARPAFHHTFREAVVDVLGVAVLVAAGVIGIGAALVARFLPTREAPPAAWPRDAAPASASSASSSAATSTANLPATYAD